MPKYNNLDEFMKRVKWSNDHFEKYKNSSLHDLIEVLKSDDGNADKVKTELGKIPKEKTLKYKDALYYLLSNYGGVTPADVTWSDLNETNAAKFPKTELPEDYDPKSIDKTKKIVKGVPPTAFLDQTCETFLLSSNENNGVIVIHLGGFHSPMNTEYNGYKVVDHINSVLRVAKETNTDLCVLHMHRDKPVCDELSEAYKAFDVPTAVFRGEGHMGSVNETFRDFSTSHDNCVVMGFDGTICVHANIFGAPEYLPSEEPAPPLLTLTNVITSRAVLVTSGKLYPKNWQKEYGVLEGT